MKTNIVVLSILAVYFGLLATVYTVWSLIADGAMEWAGSLAIALSGVLSLLIAFFLQIQFNNQGGELPEDRLDANIDDGDAELGFFSPWSWWPVSPWLPVLPLRLRDSLWVSGSPFTAFPWS